MLKINDCTICVGMTDIKPVSEVHNLGSWFDCNFSMSTHISKYCIAAFFWLHSIKRISKFLWRDKLETVLHAFITSSIDYCNGLLYGLPDCEIAKLHRVQNAVAWLLTLSCKYDHITPVLQELHWVPVKFRIHFKILLTFKALNDVAPAYISDLINVRKHAGYSLCHSPLFQWWQNSVFLLLHAFIIALRGKGFNCSFYYLWDCSLFKLHQMAGCRIHLLYCTNI